MRAKRLRFAVLPPAGANAPTEGEVQEYLQKVEKLLQVSLGLGLSLLLYTVVLFYEKGYIRQL